MTRAIPLLLVLLAACTSSNSSSTSGGASSGGGPGAVCRSGADCGSGLSCFSLAVFSPDAGDAGCTSPGNACSIECKTDLDCNSLGPKYMCFQGCGPAKFCGATP